jgi:hypothetical protein
MVRDCVVIVALVTGLAVTAGSPPAEGQTRFGPLPGAQVSGGLAPALPSVPPRLVPQPGQLSSPPRALDPRTGLPLSTPVTLDPRTRLPQWTDPQTGLPRDPRTGTLYDPTTARPLDPASDMVNREQRPGERPAMTRPPTPPLAGPIGPAVPSEPRTTLEGQSGASAPEPR